MVGGGGSGSQSSQNGSGDINDKRSKFQKSLPKLTTNFSWLGRPKFLKRNKTTDAVHETKLSGPQQPIHVQRHDCSAPGAECMAGPSTPPKRPTPSNCGRYSYPAHNGHLSTSTTYCTSTGMASRRVSATTSGRSSSAWTQITTPDRTTRPHTFMPRPGIIPDTSSAEEEACSAERSSTTYSRRTSGGAAEVARLHSDWPSPSQSDELAQEMQRQWRHRSQPTSTSHRSSFSSSWRTLLTGKPDKGKAKAREYSESIDGPMSRKARKKNFAKPPRPPRFSRQDMPPVLTDPGHDDWADMPLLQRKTISARVSSTLSKYTWSVAVAKKRQPPVAEPVGPAGERSPDLQPCSTPRSDIGSRIHHIHLGVSSSRIVPAGLPASLPEDVDESDNYPSPSSSNYLLSGGEDYSSSDEQTRTLPRSRKPPPRDSTQPRQCRSESIDLGALNSEHVKAAGFEKLCCSKSKSKDGHACFENGASSGGQQKFEMWRTKSRAEEGVSKAQFVMCQGEGEGNREMEV